MGSDTAAFRIYAPNRFGASAASEPGSEVAKPEKVTASMQWTYRGALGRGDGLDAEGQPLAYEGMLLQHREGWQIVWVAYVAGQRLPSLSGTSPFYATAKEARRAFPQFIGQGVWPVATS